MIGGIIARILRAQRLVTIVGLGLLTVLAWAWLAVGAGMANGAQFSLHPFTGIGIGSGMVMGDWSPRTVAITISMWWVMMIAMMVPAAAPVVLLYDRSYRASYSAEYAPIWQFVAGYLLVWGAFSIGAGMTQIALGRAAMLTMGMAFDVRAISAVVLIAAGLYQLSPLKRACLEGCRNPAQFIARFHSPGAAGALKLGLIHGAYCLGCCWILMLLLFVGGVMNLVWVAVLALAVAIEKLLPQGQVMARLLGLGFILWGGLLLLQPAGPPGM